jgi:hypothetical protein
MLKYIQRLPIHVQKQMANPNIPIQMMDHLLSIAQVFEEWQREHPDDSITLSEIAENAYTRAEEMAKQKEQLSKDFHET